MARCSLPGPAAANSPFYRQGLCDSAHCRRARRDKAIPPAEGAGGRCGYGMAPTPRDTVVYLVMPCSRWTRACSEHLNRRDPLRVVLETARRVHPRRKKNHRGHRMTPWRWGHPGHGGRTSPDERHRPQGRFTTATTACGDSDDSLAPTRPSRASFTCQPGSTLLLGIGNGACAWKAGSPNGACPGMREVVSSSRPRRSTPSSIRGDACSMDFHRSRYTAERLRALPLGSAAAMKARVLDLRRAVPTTDATST